MASVSELARQTQKFTIDNSPLILTVVGAAGVITTGVLAFKGGLKVAHILEEDRQKHALHREAGAKPYAPTAQEKFLMTWQCYLPACGVGALTVAAVVGANRIGTRRAAAMAVAYTVSEKAFEEYRDKVQEKIGLNKERQVKEEMAQDRVNRNYDEDKIVVVGDGQQLCHDSWSGRFFTSDMESIKHAVNRLNNEVNHNGYASLTDFYDYLGLDRIAESDEVGWNGDKLLEVTFSTVLAPSGKPAIDLQYHTMPVRDYYRFR